MVGEGCWEECCENSGCWRESWRGCCEGGFLGKEWEQHPCQHSRQHPEFSQHSSLHPPQPFFGFPRFSSPQQTARLASHGGWTPLGEEIKGGRRKTSRMTPLPTRGLATPPQSSDTVCTPSCVAAPRKPEADQTRSLFADSLEGSLSETVSFRVLHSALALRSRLSCTDRKSGLRPEMGKKWLKNGFSPTGKKGKKWSKNRKIGPKIHFLHILGPIFSFFRHFFPFSRWGQNPFFWPFFSHFGPEVQGNRDRNTCPYHGPVFWRSKIIMDICQSDLSGTPRPEACTPSLCMAAFSPLFRLTLWHNNSTN